MTLRRALAPDGDSVVYQDRVIHVASWAAKFLFTGEQLNQPVERLSGGERARVLIAQLMLQPADILLLDEPTNDLDIPTLEILEESLLEFRGSLVLVTHDRYMLDRVSTSFSDWTARATPKVSPTTRNGNHGRLKAARRQKSPERPYAVAPAIAGQEKNCRTRTPGNTRASSSALRMQNSFCK